MLKCQKAKNNWASTHFYWFLQKKKVYLFRCFTTKICRLNLPQAVYQPYLVYFKLYLYFLGGGGGSVITRFNAKLSSTWLVLNWNWAWQKKTCWEVGHLLRLQSSPLFWPFFNRRSNRKVPYQKRCRIPINVYSNSKFLTVLFCRSWVSEIRRCWLPLLENLWISKINQMFSLFCTCMDETLE